VISEVAVPGEQDVRILVGLSESQISNHYSDGMEGRKTSRLADVDRNIVAVGFGFCVARERTKGRASRV